MLRRAGLSLKNARRARTIHLGSLHRRIASSKTGAVSGLVLTAVAVGTVAWHTSSHPIHNESPVQLGAESRTDGVSSAKGSAASASAQITDPNVLTSFVWGSNRSRLLDPNAPDDGAIRTPAAARWLDNVALRDLALHKAHAACVDARGDVYQWGEGHGSSSAGASGRPSLTLRGKNIVQLQLTEDRVYALSATGQVYALEAAAAKQSVVSNPSTSSWWSMTWIWGQAQNVDFVHIMPNCKLNWGEKFTSIVAGDDHLLALTSKGRTFAHPVSLQANSHGQLGLRKLDLPVQTQVGMGKDVPRREIEMIPKSVRDPYARTTPYARTGTSQSGPLDDLTGIRDGSIRFCDRLFEIPSLKGVGVAQIAAGARSSYVRTTTGRVLGWGANDFGQIGLGNEAAIDTITIPTEVVLWRNIPLRMRSKCLNVSAAGNLTCFTVERVDEASGIIVDLLMCGNGQWGGLGNNVYSNAQGLPLRARNVSGLREFSEETQSLAPITPQSITISPTGHVMVTMNNSSGEGGRDLFVWGRNHDSELGNGKKSSSPSPSALNLVEESGEEQRFMLEARKAKEVQDLEGKVWKRGVRVEQKAVAGYGNSAVFWKITS